MVTMSTTRAAMETIEMAETYKGWDISYAPPPIPVRSFDWTATHKDYEAWMEDGDWQHNGLCLHAPNRSELLQAIINWDADNA